MYSDVSVLRQRLEQAQENLVLIEERCTQYVEGTEVPLQLIKQERRLRARVAGIKRQLMLAQPLQTLRSATKLLMGPVAEALEGRSWRRLEQQCLTMAYRTPVAPCIDQDALARTTDELRQLREQLEVLLDAYGVEPHLAFHEPLRRRAAQLARLLLAIYRLPENQAPELGVLLSED